MGEMLCCVVVGIVSTTSSLIKCDGVWISCCVRFFAPLKVFCVLINVEIKLIFSVLSVNVAV